MPQKREGQFQKSRYRIRWRMPRRPLRFAVFCVVCVVLIAAVIGSIVSAVTGKKENQTSEQSVAVTPAEPVRVLNLPPASEINDMVQIAKEAQGGAGKDLLSYL